MIIRRGDIYYADLRPVVGSEQGGVRPVLVIQNDVGNKHSPTVICAAITSRMNKAKLPTHVELSARDCDMVKDSVIPVSYTHLDVYKRQSPSRSPRFPEDKRHEFLWASFFSQTRISVSYTHLSGVRHSGRILTTCLLIFLREPAMCR